jgi:mRNA interferase MazF
VFVVVSRQALIDSAFSSVICAPVYSQHDGLSTQVPVGVAEGLKKESSIHCDDLVSLPKSALTNYVGSMRSSGLASLDRALAIALGLDAGWSRHLSHN